MKRVEIEKKVNATMEFYDFIMISDYFDESLILMKEKFCLDWEDVLVFAKNVGSRKRNDISTGMMMTRICPWLNNILIHFDKTIKI